MASVTVNGQILSMTDAAMEHFNLHQGQEVPPERLFEILAFKASACQRKIAEQKEDEILRAETID